MKAKVMREKKQLSKILLNIVKDKAEVLVECGTGPLVSGFPQPVASAQEVVLGEFMYLWPYVISRPGIYRVLGNV